MNAVTLSHSRSHRILLSVAMALAAGSAPTHAKEMDHSKPPIPEFPAQEPAAEPDTQSDSMDHSAMGHEMYIPADEPRQPIPPLTDADRSAAFPDVGGHAAHDNSMETYVMFDELEAWNTGEGSGLAWEALGWAGTDLNRLLLRSEGECVKTETEFAGDIEVLYSRSVARRWDVVAGVRHDFGPSRSFAAIGMIGLAPFKFDVEATAYIGESGQTGARFEAGYDTLLTNRLILRWLVQADLYGEDDARRGIGSGLSTVDAGLRLRYELTRKVAPYIGVTWERAYAGTADFRRSEGKASDDTRLVAGLRIWF